MFCEDCNIEVMNLKQHQATKKHIKKIGGEVKEKKVYKYV